MNRIFLLFRWDEPTTPYRAHASRHRNRPDKIFDFNSLVHWTYSPIVTYEIFTWRRYAFFLFVMSSVLCVCVSVSIRLRIVLCGVTCIDNYTRLCPLYILYRFLVSCVFPSLPASLDASQFVSLLDWSCCKVRMVLCASNCLELMMVPSIFRWLGGICSLWIAFLVSSILSNSVGC